MRKINKVKTEHLKPNTNKKKTSSRPPKRTKTITKSKKSHTTTLTTQTPNTQPDTQPPNHATTQHSQHPTQRRGDRRREGSGKGGGGEGDELANDPFPFLFSKKKKIYLKKLRLVRLTEVRNSSVEWWFLLPFSGAAFPPLPCRWSCLASSSFWSCCLPLPPVCGAGSQKIKHRPTGRRGRNHRCPKEGKERSTTQQKRRAKHQ